MKKVVICGGHLTPALALIEELENKDIEVIFLGREKSTEGATTPSAESKIIKGKKIKFYNITTGRLQRKFTKYTIPSLLKIPVGVIQSMLYLMKERPALVVSFGGYLSTPIIFSAWLLGVPSITHEQAAVPGLANRINSLFVEKIYVAWRETKQYFQQEKTEIIGNPIRKSIFSKNAKSPKISQFIKNKNPIFVSGGNLGSHFLNQLVLKSLKKLNHYKIIHQIGTANYKDDYKEALKHASRNYLPIEYITDADIGAVISASKIIIARSGANTVWELGALGKVALLVPLPIAGSAEQLANAKILEKAGSSLVVNQKDLDEKSLVSALNAIEKNYTTLEKHAVVFKKSLPSTAARILASKVLVYTKI